MKNLIWLVVFVCGLVTYPCLSFSENIAFQDGVYSACCFDDNKAILAERVSPVEGSGEYYRVRIDNADNVSALSLEAQREVSFKIINQGNPLANAEVNIYSDVNTQPEAYGRTNPNGILYDWGDSCLFTVDDGSYTVFVVSAADRTAILKTIDVSSSGEILIDITNEWAATTTLTVNARKLDSADPLNACLYISISPSWPENIGWLDGGNADLNVTPHIYYYLGAWWGDDSNYYLYKSNLSVPPSGNTVNFHPTSQTSSILEVNVNDFDSYNIVPWLEDPNVHTAPCLRNSPFVMTPGIYSIWIDLEKDEWSFTVWLMENYTFLPASIVGANAGGNFSIETFETGSLAYKPGDRVDFSIRLNDQYGNRLCWSSYNGQSNYPSLIIRDPGNNVVYDGPTSFYSYYYTLAATAIQGNYAATLTFDTGPHQGVISATTSFQVGNGTAVLPAVYNLLL
jgi:hypothetical protein